MHRCANALCNDLVNRRRTHHRLGDAYYCSSECVQQWIETNERLSTAARRFFDQPARQRPFIRERA